MCEFTTDKRAEGDAEVKAGAEDTEHLRTIARMRQLGRHDLG